MPGLRSAPLPSVSPRRAAEGAGDPRRDDLMTKIIPQVSPKSVLDSRQGRFS